jgi:hypothetical protein
MVESNDPLIVEQVFNCSVKTVREALTRPEHMMKWFANYGLESFPQDIPELSRDSCKVGWNYFIRGKLYQFLEN